MKKIVLVSCLLLICLILSIGCGKMTQTPVAEGILKEVVFVDSEFPHGSVTIDNKTYNISGNPMGGVLWDENGAMFVSNRLNGNQENRIGQYYYLYRSSAFYGQCFTLTKNKPAWWYKPLN